MHKRFRSHEPGIRIRFCAAVLVCFAPAGLPAQAISDIRVETPRDFGYTIGDKIRHRMYLSLGDAYRLDATSIPEAGRLNRWLEISNAEYSVESREQNTVYHIVVDYQVFNAPQQLTPVTVPQLEFLTTDGTNAVPVFLPEWTFTISPITTPLAQQNHQLRSDREPRPIPVQGRGLRLAVSMFVLASLLAHMAYTRVLRPRLKREQYPFSNALAELRKVQRAGSTAENYRLGLRTFHAAVNATASQVIFAANLDDFLSENSKFAEVKPELAALYTRSQQVFFDDSDIAESGASLQALIDLCRHCRALERSVA